MKNRERSKIPTLSLVLIVTVALLSSTGSALAYIEKQGGNKLTHAILTVSEVRMSSLGGDSTKLQLNGGKPFLYNRCNHPACDQVERRSSRN